MESCLSTSTTVRAYLAMEKRKDRAGISAFVKQRFGGTLYRSI